MFAQTNICKIECLEYPKSASTPGGDQKPTKKTDMAAMTLDSWMYKQVPRAEVAARIQTEHATIVPYYEIAGQNFSVYKYDNFGRMVDLANAVVAKALPQLGLLRR
jgi:hypothetical protein